jgi:hypothetical protein
MLRRQPTHDYDPPSIQGLSTIAWARVAEGAREIVPTKSLGETRVDSDDDDASIWRWPSR